jgi:hypothetical protein
MTFELKKTETYMSNAMIGFYGTDELRDRLKLMAVYKELFMADILRSIVDTYLEDQPTLSKLTKLLAKRGHKEWDALCLKKHGKNGWRTSNQLTDKWDKFTEKAAKSLKSRRIPEDLVDMIIEEMNQLETDR